MIETIAQIHKEQQNFFATHETTAIDFRIESLKTLRETILKNEVRIYEALWLDLPYKNKLKLLKIFMK